jgi:sterol desaturase/sphingolipid hydroxylase (fatty acid hydroxylase superfamily)
MWESLPEWWNSLPAPLRDPVAFAIPFFVLFLALEWAAARYLTAPEMGADGRAHPPRGGYDAVDARTSISMGAVSVLTSAAWKALALVGYAAIYAYLAPWHLPADAWYTWVILIVGVDLLFYWYHRIAHRTRIVWATHQAHHSSEYFNFATALRQKWNNSGEILMWIPLPLIGIPPWMVFVGFSINLVYQFFVHTERVDRLPRPFELVFNTPSHHRVHHGCDPEYLDKNYAGILIIWDRMFGTFTPETHRPTYGLTTPVRTHNILTLQGHEYAAIGRDIRAAGSWRERFGYVFGPPGWTP